MKIDKAILILNDLLKRYDFIDAKETHAAVKLSIEALKRIRYDRLHRPDQLLPGESLI